jgi:hypothetical protein
MPNHTANAPKMRNLLQMAPPKADITKDEHYAGE